MLGLGCRVMVTHRALHSGSGALLDGQLRSGVVVGQVTNHNRWE